MANTTRLFQQIDHYRTKGGITVHRVVDDLPVTDTIEPLLDGLDTQRGALFASSYEYPGRYTRWDMGFLNPPLVLESKGLNFGIESISFAELKIFNFGPVTKF